MIVSFHMLLVVVVVAVVIWLVVAVAIMWATSVDEDAKFAMLIDTIREDRSEEPTKTETEVTYKYEPNYRREAIMAQRARTSD